jgi:thioredoxin reductase (NADPH)
MSTTPDLAAASTTPDPMAAIEARRAQMFPALSAAQLARITRFGKERLVAAGTLLFDEGDRGVPMHVILEGAVEVVHPRGSIEEPITVHGPGEFTGEVSSLADRPSLVRGRVTMQSRVLEIPHAALRSIVQTDPDLSELLLRAYILRRMGLLAGHLGDVVVLGSRHSAETLRLQEFLTRNGHPYRYVDVEVDDNVQALLDTFHVGVGDVPVLVCRGELVLKNPSNAQVADCLGFNTSIEPGAVLDVVVVGAGPAGLAAAVYGASEGLDVLVLESSSPGGQAGSSSKIENYLGFPTGISGQALAQRALAQAEKFGARVAIARVASRLHCDELPYRIETADGESIRSRAIVIATGAEYRKLDIPDRARFEGVGIYYGATFVEAQRCAAEQVIVVGGGNSAGQAATFLAQSSSHVHVFVRSSGLAASMSRYLIRRIEETPNITLHTHTRITGLSGGEHLEQVTWTDDGTGETYVRPIRHVFSMTGAKPNTEWLQGCVKLDDKGFILTGADLAANPEGAARTSAPRAALLHETSIPKVFAVGDVRANSVKRVASGVGEGSVCIQLVHKVLAE